jgi:hypothetical protein
MAKLTSLFATVTMGILLFSADPLFASPLGKAVQTGDRVAFDLENGLLQKVHRWHCERRKGWYKGKRTWHRHRRACRNRDYLQPYPGSYWGPAPLPYYGYYEWRRERRNWLWD